jgi:trimethylamine--corrinoid protein Co-methyltransferase
MTRLGYDKWQASGGKSLLDRAREKLQHILRTHHPVPLEEEKRKAIQKRIDRFKAAQV